MKSTVYSSRAACDVGARLRARRVWVHRYLSCAGLGAALVAAVPRIGIGWWGTRTTPRFPIVTRRAPRSMCRVLVWPGPRAR